MQEAYIVAYGRSAVAKGKKDGAYFYDRPEDIAAQVLKGVINRVEGDFDPTLIEDVIVGCSTPEGLQGNNIARAIALRSGLPETVAGQTVNRFCSSGLQTIATAANAIIAGQAEVLAAGGIEFMSSTQMGGSEPSNSPYLQENGPKIAVPMGMTAENVAEKYNVSRKEQDQFGVESHQKAHIAQTEGRFKDEIIPVEIHRVKTTGDKVEVTTEMFDQDEGIRPNTTLDVLGKLRTVFKADGSVTAGTSSQVSDGAGFVILMSGDKVKELGIKPIARFVSFNVAGVDPKFMGIGPVYAVPKALKLAGLKLDDMDLIEFNEAFAAQAIASMNELGMNRDIVNVNGGGIALGHPLGATGAILTAKLLGEMAKRPETKYGMVTMCIGMGMGAAGVFEYLR
ncbi:acetyl-CoA acyltransferase [Carnobacterium alterfunditum]|uniref:acetyl-CoA C-acyltransferase n=1 Tax=Carnobacterium alterfunditum TaxID=28230 RepID=A0A1N6HNC9_9LACT|nr:acetyl-CoA C-acyltransferase [Carnobacterium alterfunditum]SIO21271.1 acetyl-CoA acyltransferase [Carnobacterium alterfunditum]